MFELDRIIRPNIKALKPYASARDEFSGTEGVFLDANENPFGQYNRYPDPYQKELKTKIGELKYIDESKIFLGNGSDEIIDLCFRIFCEPGKSKVLSFTPTYGMYDVSAAINDVEMINLELNSKFQIDFANLLPYLDDEDLRMIFICSPNNPTGNLMDPQTIERILNSFDGIVIIDEAYIDFSGSNSWIKNLSKFPNLIITQTFSKAWGMAGARVGMAFTSKEIISYLNKIKPPYNISTLNQNLIMDGLKSQAKSKQNIDILIQERIRLLKELGRISSIKKVYSSNANFILIKVKDADEVYRQLLNKNIILRNRNSVLEGCLRITVGSASENTKIINELKNI